ncbi:MAG: hypothetical protein ACKVTZ_05025 [Bacteroidia bacterium]
MTYPIDFCPPNGVVTYEYPTQVNWLHEGIFYIYSKPGVEHTLEDAQRQTKIVKEMFGNEKVFMIIDIRKSVPMGVEARNYYSSPEGSANCSAFCFLVDSPVSKVIANLFLTVLRPKLPLKMVSSVEEAISWGKMNNYL